MIPIPTLEAALKAALRNPDPDALRAVIRALPTDLIQSESQRRRSAMRTNFRGPTGHWSKHNPDVNNCRCKGCHDRKQEAL